MVDDGYGRPGEEVADTEGHLRAVDDSREADHCGGEGDDDAQLAKARPAPEAPSNQDWDRQMLTRLPYKRWCPHSVLARRNRDPDCRLPTFSNAVPLTVADDCFVWMFRDPGLLVVMVVRMYPSMATYAIPCVVKGSGSDAGHRLAAFICMCGVVITVLVCNQASSLNTYIRNALRQVKVDGEWAGAMHDHSAVECGSEQWSCRGQQKQPRTK